MKTWQYVLPSLTLAALSVFSSVKAQNETPGQQANIPTTQKKANFEAWMRWEVHLKPEEVPAFRQKLSSLIRQAGGDLSHGKVLTHYQAPSTFYFYFPMQSFKEWEEIYNYWDQQAENSGLKKHMISHSFILFKIIPQFMQILPNRRLNIHNPHFLHSLYIEVFPDATQRFEKLLQEWVTQTKASYPDCVWFTDRVLVGTNLPTYMVVWGDCLESEKNKNFIPLDKFLKDKNAFGSIVKRIDISDLENIPNLSTLQMPVNPPQ